MRRAVAVVAALGLSGCAWWPDAPPGVDQVCGPEVNAVPCAVGAQEGVEYRYWGNAERGVITLVGSDEAVFVGRGLEVRFEPARAGYRPPPCA